MAEMILSAGIFLMPFSLYASESDLFQRFPVARSYAARTSAKCQSAFSCFSRGAAARLWFLIGRQLH